MLAGLLAILVGCAGLGRPDGLNVVTAKAPSESERYCAWYGDDDGATLYVGQAPFWSAMRASGGDPTADLREPGPQWIGRFDLARERWRQALDVGRPDGRSGVWDVHLHTDGQLYFTTFFGTGGRVDPESGVVTHFDAAGRGLNELAPGPGGDVLVSRYSAGDGVKRGGELLTLDSAGQITRRWPLPAPTGFLVAPKTPAWNAAGERLIATTDLLPEFDGETRHAAYRLLPGEDWQWSYEPELQFVASLEDGTEYRVESHADGRLWLRRIGSPGARIQDARVLLDPRFPAGADFVQDLKTAADGRLVLTRWSGKVHVVASNGSVATVELPRLDPQGLYYTAVIHGERLCASYCADVTMVCVDAP